MIKFKHFLHIEGQEEKKELVMQALEDFVNTDGVSILEVGHSHTVAPYRSISIFVSYVELSDEEKETIKIAAQENARRRIEDRQGTSNDTQATTLPAKAQKPSNKPKKN